MTGPFRGRQRAGPTHLERGKERRRNFLQNDAAPIFGKAPQSLVASRKAGREGPLVSGEKAGRRNRGSDRTGHAPGRAGPGDAPAGRRGGGLGILGSDAELQAADGDQEKDESSEHLAPPAFGKIRRHVTVTARAGDGIRTRGLRIMTPAR